MTSASVVHLELINKFYSTFGSARIFKSHSACFGCLREYPEFPLPWHNFSLDVFKFHRDLYIETRYQRINPDLGSTPPPMDKVNRIEEVRKETRNQLENRDRSVQKIREISSRLIASSFYLEESSTPRDPGGNFFRGNLMVLDHLVLYIKRHQRIVMGRCDSLQISPRRI